MVDVRLGSKYASEHVVKGTFKTNNKSIELQRKDNEMDPLEACFRVCFYL